MANHKYHRSPRSWLKQPLNASHWRTAVANVKANTANANVLILGDSPQYAVNLANQRLAYPHYLRDILNTTVAPCTDGICFGDGVIPTFTVVDDRTALGTGWTDRANGAATGTYNGLVSGALSAAGQYVYTPDNSFDTVTIYWLRLAGGGTFTVRKGATSLGSINTAGATSVQSTTFSCVAGTGTVNIDGPSVAAIYIWGINCQLSTQKTIQLHVGAVDNTAASGWGTTPPFPHYYQAMPKVVAPDLCIVCIGLFDAFGAHADTAFDTGIANFFTTNAPSNCDFLLVSAPVGATTMGTSLAAYAAKLNTRAAANSYGFLDVNGLFVNYTTANTNGYTSDTLHLNAAGHQVMAGWLAQSLAVLV